MAAAARGSNQLALTIKGSEELTLRTYRLDIKLRNILFLIQKGTPTLEAILQNSIFPREEVIDKLRMLLKEQFVEMGSAGAALARPDVGITMPAASRAPAASSATLADGVALSQARFVLTDFCLDQFGTRATPLAQALDAAADLTEMQQALDDIAAQVRKHLAGQWPVLMDKVREINQTAV